MKVIKDYRSLTRDQLIDALVFTVTDDFKKKDIRKYYSLLPLDELQRKASEVGELYLPEHRVASYEELLDRKRIAVRLEAQRHQEREKVVEIQIPKAEVHDDDWKIQTALMFCKGVTKVTIIAPGVLGIKCTAERKAYVERYIKRMQYDGEVIYG